MQEKMEKNLAREKAPKKFWNDASPRAKLPSKNMKNKNELLILKIKIMIYYFNKTLHGKFEDIIDKVTEGLKEEGFGILTEIDIKETLKKKLDVDFKKYRILGACNPPYAYKALLAENKIGTMLPCNVIVQEVEAGVIEVAAVNPMASMMAVENENLNTIAKEITVKLEKIVKAL